jgi:hypothetical protein
VITGVDRVLVTFLKASEVDLSGAIRAQGLTVTVRHPGGRESGHLTSPTAALNASSGYAELSILKETGLR